MLNDYYQNVGIKGFIRRYGIVNAVKRGLYITVPLHFVQSYEMKKLLWQEIAGRKLASYLKYSTCEPEGLSFPGDPVEDPIWVYWEQGMENAPAIVKRCYESLLKYGGREVILLTRENLGRYLRMPEFIEIKKEKGFIPLAVYTDLIRFSLLEHYGGTWIDATVLLTEQIPEQIRNCGFFALRNTLGLLNNPALYPVWFLHAQKHNLTIAKVRNVSFAFWKNENHLTEYLTSNLILTQVLKQDSAAEKEMPYMNSDYSEYLVKVLGEEFSEEKWDWIKSLTGIHKLTYKLDEKIDRKDTFYRRIVGEQM